MFSYKDHVYEGMPRMSYSRHRLVQRGYLHVITTPEGEKVILPYHPFRSLTITQYHLWVDIRIGFYDVDYQGYQYRPVRRGNWESNRNRFKHCLLHPDGSQGLIPFNRTLPASSDLFKFWIDMGLLLPEQFGRKNFSMNFLRRLREVSEQFNVPPGNADTLAVLMRMN